jgi:dolichol-phosphate mannosyltransferase
MEHGEEKLSILIPTFDEGRTIVELLARIRSVSFGLPVETIVVDDGSTDDTAELVRREIARDATIRLVQKPNGGKGSAVRAGLAVATGTIAVVQDADLEYDPREIPALLVPILEGRAVVVYGSRLLAHGRSDYTALRYYVGGRALTLLTNLLYGSRLTDEPTCYKVVRVPLLRELALTRDGFEFCPELTGKLLRRGIPIVELPISYDPRSVEEGKKIRVCDLFTAIRVLIHERLRSVPSSRRAASDDPSDASSRAGRVRLLVVVVAAAGTAAVVELGVRVRYGNDVSRITGAAEWQTAEWKGLVYSWDLYHPRLGWTNLPGYRSGADVPFRITINAQGLRGTREYEQISSPAVRRIALFGDSFAFGLEVDDDETVPAQLESRLVGSEVLNFGVNGYGLGQMVLRIEEDGLAHAPHHIVLVVLLPTDLARDPVSHFTHAKPTFGVGESGLVIGNVPVPEASREPWFLRHVFTAAWIWGRPTALPGPEKYSDLLRVTRALLERVMESTRPLGVPVTLVALAGGPQFEQDNWPRMRAAIADIVDAMRALGLDVLDLTGFLEEAYRAEGRELALPLGHWSARANCLIAERIAQHLGGLGGGWRVAAREVPCTKQ